ncbi:MAG: hypothetical protein ACRDU9_05980 [Acidimicrobiia bacterium]
MQPYTLEQLREMPTIRSGPVNDLKIDTGATRVWVRREPGSPAITVLVRDYGCWERVGAFNDRLSVPCQRLVER